MLFSVICCSIWIYEIISSKLLHILKNVPQLEHWNTKIFFARNATVPVTPRLQSNDKATVRYKQRSIVKINSPVHLYDYEVVLTSTKKERGNVKTPPAFNLASRLPSFSSQPHPHGTTRVFYSSSWSNGPLGTTLRTPMRINPFVLL